MKMDPGIPIGSFLFIIHTTRWHIGEMAPTDSLVSLVEVSHVEDLTPKNAGLKRCFSLVAKLVNIINSNT